MALGQQYPAEWIEYKDPLSDVRVRQLTNVKAHSHHLYFTNPGWYDGGKKLLFVSERDNATNVYGMSLADGIFTQLTELPPLENRTTLLNMSRNPLRDEAYFWVNGTLWALNIANQELTELTRLPQGFVATMTSVTADGRYVCTGIYQDLSKRFRVNLEHGYIGFREYWAAHPLSRILRVEIKTGKTDVVFEERNWIGHINTSPKVPHIATFCHEGPWERVDNRIWGLDINTGMAWRIRPTAPGDTVGHEYWFADGEHIGFHGRRGPTREPFFGSIRYDNMELVEAVFPFGSTHFHSNALDLIVGDGSVSQPYIMLWRYRRSQFEGPHVLAVHRGSFHVQILHVHPRFSPDGRQVLLTADPDGYGNVYLADVPEFEDLPTLDSVTL